MAIKIGIIGCGQVAHFHVQGLKATEAEIVALADINVKSADVLSQKIGDVEIFDNYNDMLAKVPIDAVIIGVRNNLHYQIISDCINADKAIFCEKPLTAHAKESTELVEKAKEANTIFMMGFMKRHHNAFQRMKLFVEDFGQVLHARISQCIYVPIENMEAEKLKAEWWGWDKESSRGGSLVHSGSHELDLMRWIIGEPKAITSHFKFVPGLNEMDQYCSAMIEMQGGFSTLIDITAMPYSRRAPEYGGWMETIEIYCEKGWVKLNNYTWDGSVPPEFIVYDERKKSEEIVFTENSLQWENEMQHFVDCVQDRKQPSPDIIDGYRVDQIISDAYLSAKEDRKVQISFLY